MKYRRDVDTLIQRVRGLLPVFVLMNLSACASLGTVVPETLKTEISSELSFREAIQNPSGAIGKTVLWGGTIIEAVPHSEGTRIEILQKPLGYRDRPMETDESEGRFFVERKGLFLDPAVYEKGREVTVVGEIVEERKEIIGALEYRYPYLVASFIHLWERRSIYSGNEAFFYPSPWCWHAYRDYPHTLFPDPYCFRARFWPIVYPFHMAPAAPEKTG